MEYISEYSSPIGDILLASDEKAVTGLWFKEQKYFAATLDKENGHGEPLVLKEAKIWLDGYFAGEHVDMTVPLAPKGSTFRQEVWKILMEIPYGEVAAYGEIARRMAERMGRASMSAQAVGGAVGHNPVSILIPCHRVLGTDGSLTGYAAGTDKKKWLLELEGSHICK